MKVIKNNLFMIRHIMKAVPFYILAMMIRSVLQALITAGGLFITKLIIDTLSHKSSSFFVAAIYYVVYILIEYIFSQARIILNNFFNSIKMNDLSKYMKKMLYDKTRELDLSCYENYDFHNDLERADNELNQQPEKIVNTLSDFVYYTLTLIFITIVILEPVFLLLSILVAVRHILYMNKLNRYNYELEMETSHIKRRINYIKNIFKTGAFIKESRILQNENFFIHLNDIHYEDNYKIEKKYYKKSFPISAASIFFGYVVNFLLAVYICNRIIKGRVTAGDMVYLINAFSVFADNLINLVQIASEFKDHSRYIDNIIKILSYKPCVRQDEGEIKIDPDALQLVSMKNVGFFYSDMDRKSLNHLSLTINKGEKIALVGQNGSGKSTLIKLILNLYRQQEGEILYNGNSYERYAADDIRRQYGVVFQDYQIYAFKICENVLMREIKGEADIRLVEEALQFSGLKDKVDTLEKGIYTILTKEYDQEGVYLSGGEYQKLAIARAYARNSQILVFDEPSSSLDPLVEYDFFQKITELGREKTVVYISHRMSSVVNADKIYMMKEGCIKEQGTHFELMQKKGLYYQLFLEQAKNFNA